MDVTMHNFWTAFPEVVQALVRAEYAAVDLEMTGIISKEPKLAKMGVEDVYERARKAAQTHQIIQFGLTCVSHDKKNGVHKSRTWNFALNPMSGEAAGLGPKASAMLASILDRHVCFSTSSWQFLSRHGFSFARAFGAGIPYLSHQEEEELRGLFLRPNQRKMEAFDLDAFDPVVRAFYAGAEARILAAHLPERARSFGYVNITNPHGGKLTGFQVALVHHLVETKFPDCQARPQHGDMFVQVTLANVVAKEKMLQRQLEERKEAVVRQTGFRHLVDALVGNLFTKDLRVEWMIDAEAPNRLDDGESVKEITTKLKQAEAKLASRPPILVGHNHFYDLCFMYQTFVGDLPSTVEGFRRQIHSLMPRMVDTKFLSTPPNWHIMMADENLGQLYAGAKNQALPVIIPDAAIGPHRKHQAGYDSWMTAVCYLKKAYNLAADARIKKALRRDYHGKTIKVETPVKKKKSTLSAHATPFKEDPPFFSTPAKQRDTVPPTFDFGALQPFVSGAVAPIVPSAVVRNPSLQPAAVETSPSNAPLTEHLNPFWRSSTTSQQQRFGTLSDISQRNIPVNLRPGSAGSDAAPTDLPGNDLDPRPNTSGSDDSTTSLLDEDSPAHLREKYASLFSPVFPKPVSAVKNSVKAFVTSATATAQRKKAADVASWVDQHAGAGSGEKGPSRPSSSGQAMIGGNVQRSVTPILTPIHNPIPTGGVVFAPVPVRGVVLPATSLMTVLTSTGPVSVGAGMNRDDLSSLVFGDMRPAGGSSSAAVSSEMPAVRNDRPRTISFGDLQFDIGAASGVRKEGTPKKDATPMKPAALTPTVVEPCPFETAVSPTVVNPSPIEAVTPTVVNPSPLNPSPIDPETDSAPEPDTMISPSHARLPPWTSSFWKQYGNKIRVGTSGSLDLAVEFVSDPKE